MQRTSFRLNNGVYLPTENTSFCRLFHLLMSSLFVMDQHGILIECLVIEKALPYIGLSTYINVS